MSRAIASLHVLLHVVEVCLQMEAAILYYYKSRIWFIVLSALVVSPLVMTNVISFTWIFRSLDFTNRPCARLVCALLHILQLGTVWRYFKYVLVGDLADYEELIFLRMIQAVLQSTPYLIIQCYLVLVSRDFIAIVVASVTTTLFSIIIAYATFIEGNAREVQKELRIGEMPVTKISVEPIVNRRRCYIWSLQVIYRVCLISSRLCALALFTASIGYWIAVPLSLHWALMMLSYGSQKLGAIKTITSGEWARLMAVCYAQTVDLLNIAENERVIIIALFYLITVVENSIFTVMSLIKLHYLAQPENKLAILTIVYGGFVIGTVFLIIYQKCLLRKNHKRTAEIRNNGCKHQRLRRESSRKESTSHEDAITTGDCDRLLTTRVMAGYTNRAYEPQSQLRRISFHNKPTGNAEDKPEEQSSVVRDGEAETSLCVASDDVGTAEQGDVRRQPSDSVTVEICPDAVPVVSAPARFIRSSISGSDDSSSESESETSRFSMTDEGQWTTCSDNDSIDARERSTLSSQTRNQHHQKKSKLKLALHKANIIRTQSASPTLSTSES